MKVFTISFVAFYLLIAAIGLWAGAHLPWDGSETTHEKICAHVYMTFAIPMGMLMKAGCGPRSTLAITTLCWALPPSILLTVFIRWRRSRTSLQTAYNR